jgi:large subunit ribosomal protein L19
MDSLSPLLDKIPDIRPGQTVRVHQRLQEGGKERIQVFEGMVLKRSAGTTASATMTVRKISEGIGVERIFPLHSPLIAKIEIVGTARVRRANISFIRRPRSRQLKSHPVNKPKA